MALQQDGAILSASSMVPRAFELHLLSCGFSNQAPSGFSQEGVRYLSYHLM